MWGNARIVAFLKKQRDLYKFIHDQTVRLLNHGLTPTEIAEKLKLPASLANDWASRGYYGTKMGIGLGVEGDVRHGIDCVAYLQRISAQWQPPLRQEIESQARNPLAVWRPCGPFHATEARLYRSLGTGGWIYAIQ